MTPAAPCLRPDRAHPLVRLGLIALFLAGSAPAALRSQGAPRRAEPTVIPAPASAIPFEGAWPIPATLSADVAFASDAELGAADIRISIFLCN